MRQDATSNGMYGHDVPGSEHWARTYLQNTPVALRNRRLDRFRTHLRTSSEEYGSYWARAVTPQGSRFQYKKTEPIFKNEQAPDMLGEQEYLHSPSLPQINNGHNDRNKTPQYRPSQPQSIHLPDIRRMEVRLTLADNSVVQLQASPRINYQF